jgi:hypothetical protein
MHCSRSHSYGSWCLIFLEHQLDRMRFAARDCLRQTRVDRHQIGFAPRSSSAFIEATPQRPKRAMERIVPPVCRWAVRRRQMIRMQQRYRKVLAWNIRNFRSMHYYNSRQGSKETSRNAAIAKCEGRLANRQIIVHIFLRARPVVHREWSGLTFEEWFGATPSELRVTRNLFVMWSRGQVVEALYCILLASTRHSSGYCPRPGSWIPL